VLVAVKPPGNNPGSSEATSAGETS
jgi:hypothetical protein